MQKLLQKNNFRSIIIHRIFNISYILKAIYGEIFHGVTVENQTMMDKNLYNNETGLFNVNNENN